MPLKFSSLDFLLRRMAMGKTGCLDRLSNDVLVDQVFIYLTIADILRLRRVSKLYYYLSQQPVVWKRLLQHIDYPLPPLPPTARHSLKDVSSLEVERLLIRPLSLEKEWQKEKADCYDEWKFNAHHCVQSMIILPGGQYLVASVSDTEEKYFSLLVFVLDHPYGRAVPLAKTPTGTKAYSLQAKYMTVKGRRGITISYICRDFRYKADARRGINISRYSGEHEVDSEVPLVYECRVLHVSLESLEILGDPRFLPGSQEFLDHAKAQPPPFRRLAVVRSTRFLGPVALDEIFGSPFIAIVRRPNSIMFKDLDGGAVSTITCMPADGVVANCPHFVEAIRLLPMQNQVFIVRRVTDVPPDHHKHDIFPVELYNVPINLTHQPIEENVNAVERVFLLDYVFVNVHITDHYHPTHDDESLQRHVLGNHSKPPRPISIIGTTTAPDGMVRLTFYPDKVEQWFPPTPVASSSSSSSRSSSPFSTKHEDKWAYSLTDCSAVRYIASPRDTGYRILPGSYRSIVYAVPKDDITNAPSIVEIKRYGDEETLRRPTPEEMADPGYMRAPRKPFHQFFWEMEKGVRVKAMAWDETIGRLCMVVEKSQVVFMLDFSKAPQEDHLGRRLPLLLPPLVVN